MGTGSLSHKGLASVNNNEIFLEFWKNYQWPETAAIFYRLYHDDDGNPVIYSMEDLPGKYVDVTLEQYRMADHRVRVVDGRIVPIDPVVQKRKMRPSVSGTACHPKDVTIVVIPSDANQAWKIDEIC